MHITKCIKIIHVAQLLSTSRVLQNWFNQNELTFHLIHEYFTSSDLRWSALVWPFTSHLTPVLWASTWHWHKINQVQVQGEGGPWILGSNFKQTRYSGFKFKRAGLWIQISKWVRFWGDFWVPEFSPKTLQVLPRKDHFNPTNWLPRCSNFQPLRDLILSSSSSV